VHLSSLFFPFLSTSPLYAFLHFLPSSCFTIRSCCQAHLSQHVALSFRNSDRFPHHYHPSPFTPSYLIFSLFLSDASSLSIVSLHLTAQSLSIPSFRVNGLEPRCLFSHSSSRSDQSLRTSSHHWYVTTACTLRNTWWSPLSGLNHLPCTQRERTHASDSAAVSAIVGQPACDGACPPPRSCAATLCCVALQYAVLSTAMTREEGESDPPLYPRCRGGRTDSKRHVRRT